MRDEGDRLLTVLFTDTEASTALQAAIGDVAAFEIVAECNALTCHEIERFDGRIIKDLGDGIMAAFDSPRRAVMTALAINRALTEHSQRNPRRAARIHAGLHTGEVLDSGDDLHGSTVSAASRICDVAEGGQILVSDVVRQLCGTLPGVVFRDVGPYPLKGFPHRWNLFLAVPSHGAHPRPMSTAFVGRTYYRDELRALMERAVRGSGALVMIGGEAGVGKTRLTQEVAHEAEQRGLAIAVGHCYGLKGDLPYMPWVEVLDTMARRVPAGQLESLVGEDASSLTQVAPELGRMLPAVPSPVEIAADQQRWYLFNAVRSFVASVAVDRPQLLVLEDLHWADDSTMSLLEHMVEHIDEVPALIVGTYRDSPAEIQPRLAETLAHLVRQRSTELLTLNALSEAEVADLLRAPRRRRSARCGGRCVLLGDGREPLLRRGALPAPDRDRAAPR